MATNQFLTEEGKIDITGTAAADLSAKQYHFVKVDTSSNIAICGANDKSAGVLQNKPTSGEQAIVRIKGVSLLKVSETVAFGNFLTPTSTGKGEVCDAANEEFGARALAAYAADDLAVVSIEHGEVTATDA